MFRLHYRHCKVATVVNVHTGSKIDTGAWCLTLPEGEYHLRRFHSPVLF